MIKEAGAEETDVHVTEDSLPQAAAGMQPNGISSEELEDGELEEEPESAEANPIANLFHVRGEGNHFLTEHSSCAIRDPPLPSQSQRNAQPMQALQWTSKKSQGCLTRLSMVVRFPTSNLPSAYGEIGLTSG